jgi:hypothetical protein
MKKVLVWIIAAAMLFALLPVVTLPAAVAAFPDVDENYEEAVNLLASRGVVFGVNGLFHPGRLVTRAEFLAMLMRMTDHQMTDYDPEPFTDVDSGDWFYEYVCKAAALDVTQGIGGGLFGPGRSITFEEMYTMTYRALVKLDLLIPVFEDETFELTEFEDADQIAGWSVSVFIEFISLELIDYADWYLNPRKMVSRAEAAQFMANIVRYIKTKEEGI